MRREGAVCRLGLRMRLEKVTGGSTPGMPSNAWSACLSLGLVVCLLISYACLCVCVQERKERCVQRMKGGRRARAGVRAQRLLACKRRGCCCTQQAPVFWMRAGLRAGGEGGADATIGASRLPSQASPGGWWNAVQGLLELAFSRSSHRLAELLVRLGLSPSRSHSLLSFCRFCVCISLLSSAPATRRGIRQLLAWAQRPLTHGANVCARCRKRVAGRYE